MSDAQNSPLFTTFRFVTGGGQPSSGKRQVAQRACSPCRRRKKRCLHGDLDETGPSTTPIGHDGQRTSGIARGKDGHDGSVPAIDAERSSRATDGGYSSERLSKRPRTMRSDSIQDRLIGDLNPQAELLAATSPTRPHTNGIGVWHQDASTVEHNPSVRGDDMFTTASLFHFSSQGHRTQLMTLLREQCLAVRPKCEHMEALENYYFENIHDMLPCIDEKLYRSDALKGPPKILQEQIICLAACANAAVAAHLQLGNDASKLKPADFGAKVLAAMRLMIELGLVADKTIVIRALLVMSIVSLSKENLEYTSQFFARAVHLGYTIGLHQPRDPARDERLSGLFCLVWTIDRMHAAIHGRPVLMHEVDMGRSVSECAKRQQPAFKMLVSIAVLLDEVISLYRPNAATSEAEIPDAQFPAFEEILVDSQALHIPSHMMSTLELFYYAVAILSCRRHTRASSSTRICRNARQESAATQIISIMSEQHTSGVIMLPFVPYALSLSLSAACRDFRHSTVVTKRSRSKAQLALACQQLQNLGTVFWSAAFMAEMATKILQDPQDQQLTGVPLALTTNPPRTAPAFRPAEIGQSFVQTSDTNFDFLDQTWNIEDLEGLLESNLDPSIPSFFQDLDFHNM